MLHPELCSEEVPVDEMDIFFDMKKGFNIHCPRASSLFCLACLHGVTQISTKYMLLYIQLCVGRGL